MDRLVEKGIQCPSSSTPREPPKPSAPSPEAAAPLADLGNLANRAAFTGSAAVAVSDADCAWADLELLEAALDAGDGGMAALRRAVDPKPLAARR